MARRSRAAVTRSTPSRSIREPTFFHGSLVAETPLRDAGLKHLPGIGLPNDRLEDLQEQAEERMLGFLAAWKRMMWLAARAPLLDALWWKASLNTTTETLVTLVVCDGWSIAEVEGLTWRNLDLRRAIARVNGDPRQVLPHTLGLLRDLHRRSEGSGPWDPMTRDEIVEKLRLGWEALVTAAKPRGRRSSPFPTWAQVLAKTDR